MSDFVGSIPRLGYKVSSPHQDGLLGRKFKFADTTLLSDGTEVTLSGMEVEAVWVKNVGSTSLSPGTQCNWSSVGTTVDGLSSATDNPAGTVDGSLSSAVAQGEKFLLITDGPTKVLSGASYSAGARLKSAANGKTIANPLSSVAELSCGFGRAIEAAGASDQLKRALVSHTGV